MPGPRVGTIEGIQILRAVAALMVVSYHARYSVPGASGWPSFGEAGVDIFFVISGFVMAHTTRNLPAHASFSDRLAVCRDFLFKRVIRVVPLYWLVLLYTSRREIARGTTSTELPLDFAFLPHPSAAYPDFLWPTVVQGWTLNYEMFFYAIFGIALLSGGRRRLLVGAALVGLVVVGAVARSSGAALDGIDWRSIAVRFYTHDLLLEFGFGVLLQYATSAGRLSTGSRPRSIALLSAGFVLLVVCHGHGARGLAQGLPAVLIVWGALGAFAKVCSPTWELLGAASYAIYLIHWASFGAVGPVAARLGAAAAHPAGSALLAVLLFGAAIGSGLALHLLVEKPFLRWAHRRLPGPAPLRPMSP